MKRASYREGIEIIALNDDPTILDPEELIGMPAVFLLAHLFGVDQEKVANDVVRYRKKHCDYSDERQKFDEQTEDRKR